MRVIRTSMARIEKAEVQQLNAVLAAFFTF